MDPAVGTEIVADPRAWLARHGDALYAFALLRVRRPDAAEDLVQETLLAAWKGRAKYSGAASERTWLTGILKNKVADWLRARVRERLTVPAAEDGDDADPFTRRGEWKVPPGRWGSDPERNVESAEFRAALRGCIGKLPTKLHDAFVLRYFDEAANTDVCGELGLTENHLWVVLHRARTRVWQCLTETWFRTGGAGP